MKTSLYIARLMGPVLLIMGLGMVIEADTMRTLTQQFLSNLSLIYLAGILTLLAGLAIVNAHNIWVSDWRVIITILGWLGILGGLFRILLPSQVQTLGAGFTTNTNGMIIGGVITLVLGAILSWVGYEHLWQEPARAQTGRTARVRPARKTAARKTAKRGPARRRRSRKRA